MNNYLYVGKMPFVNNNPNYQSKTNKFFQEKREKYNILNNKKKIISKQIHNRWKSIYEEDILYIDFQLSTLMINTNTNSSKTITSVPNKRQHVLINYEYDDYNYLYDYNYEYYEEQIYNKLKKIEYFLD